jgi:hypothetical protein
MTKHLLLIGTLMATATIADRQAYACSPPLPVKPFAIPRPSAAPVSTATSIYIVSDGRPPWVEVTANGTLVKTDGVEAVGGMFLSSARGQLWRVLGLDILQPSAEHVVSATLGGQKVELTRFTTASGYDKQQGSAPLLRSAKFWRVHYPPEMIGGGSCVFAEYHAFISLDYDAASIPDTPPESVTYSVVVYPKSHSSQQALYFSGADPFRGGEPKPPDYFPGMTYFPSDLDPTLQYCAMLSARGYGDIARLALWSSEVCASVTPLWYGPQPDGALVVGDRGQRGGEFGSVPTARTGCSCSVGGDHGDPSSISVALALFIACSATKSRQKREGRGRHPARRPTSG